MAIKTSIGTPTANSYISVASANTYFNALQDAEGWTEISVNTNATAAETQKENLLIQATREIDNTYRYHGQKYNVGIRGEDNYQSLEFPRSSNVDANSDLYIPYEIQEGTLQQVLWVLERPGKRTNADGATTQFQAVGDQAYNYINEWVKRQIEPAGHWKWEGSDF